VDQVLLNALDTSQPTIKHYFDIVSGTFLWKALPNYTLNPAKQYSRMPKGYIRDSGLLCYLLNIQSPEQLLNHPQFGFIWESFVTEQIVRLLQSKLLPFKAYSYRSRNHAEIDLIIEGRFGCIPIEIKSGSSIRSNQLQGLTHFIENNNCTMGLLINRSEKVEQLTAHIIQVPFDRVVGLGI